MFAAQGVAKQVRTVLLWWRLQISKDLSDEQHTWVQIVLVFFSTVLQLIKLARHNGTKEKCQPIHLTRQQAQELKVFESKYYLNPGLMNKEIWVHFIVT